MQQKRKMICIKTRTFYQIKTVKTKHSWYLFICTMAIPDVSNTKRFVQDSKNK